MSESKVSVIHVNTDFIRNNRKTLVRGIFVHVKILIYACVLIELLATTTDSNNKYNIYKPKINNIKDN